MKNAVWLTIIFLFSLWACNKTTAPTDNISIKDTGLIILNEGNYTYGNASVSYFDIRTHSLVNNAFYKANGYNLGDIAQSAFVSDGYIYIVVNNSGKIVKTNAANLKQVGVLSGLVSPRYTALLGDDRAIVTDLYSPFLTVFDLQNMTIDKKIFIGHTAERILAWDGYLYTISWDNDSMLFKIDEHTWSVVDSIALTYQPNSMVMDKDSMLWVLSDGGLWQGSDRIDYPALTQIRPSDMYVLKTLRFNNKTLSPSHLVINTTKDTLYFLISSWTGTSNPVFGVYRMSINDSLPALPWIKQHSHTFYALEYINAKNWIVVTDARDFTTNGNVLIYDRSGNLLMTLPVGIIPGFVLYKK